MARKRIGMRSGLTSALVALLLALLPGCSPWGDRDARELKGKFKLVLARQWGQNQQHNPMLYLIDGPDAYVLLLSLATEIPAVDDSDEGPGFLVPADGITVGSKLPAFRFHSESVFEVRGKLVDLPDQSGLASRDTKAIAVTRVAELSRGEGPSKLHMGHYVTKKNSEDKKGYVFVWKGEAESDLRRDATTATLGNNLRGGPPMNFNEQPDWARADQKVE